MTLTRRPQFPSLDEPPDATLDFGTRFGLLARQQIELMVRRKMIGSLQELEPSQLQPASLDLRLGPKAYRVRASFLPGKDRTVEEQLQNIKSAEISLESAGTVLEKGCVYVAQLMENLSLPSNISAIANPKSSTGRLDIFTRLITDGGEAFDSVPVGYKGPLYAEISPRSFGIRVRKGSSLNQIRFRILNSQHLHRVDFRMRDQDLVKWHEKTGPLVDGTLYVRAGLVLRVALGRDTIGERVGYRAQKNTEIIDVDQMSAYAVADFWDPIAARPDGRLILDPGDFYILASQEKLHIPPELAAEMVPIDPSMGEFRVHYAGFFDPGFGFTTTGHPGARAVLEVRSHEVPFILEDGQIIGRLAYEKLADEPKALYGATGASNYQGQGLKLSKHFM